MLAAFVIVFREVIEAGLVVGVVLAATRGLVDRGRFIAGGILAGFLGACGVAFFAGAIADLFEGSGQETLNAGVLLVAVAMLIWHNAWMASHGRELAQSLKAVGEEVKAGRKSLMALAIVCAVAVLREGSEVVLFLYGVAAAGQTTASSIIVGGLIGIAGGAVISALLYLGLIAIPLRYLFGVLSALITLLAAGLAAQAMRFLAQGGWLANWVTPLWNTSGILSEQSIPGRIAHVLFGYASQPSASELLAYGMVIVIMLVIRRIVAEGRGHQPQGARISA
ncbi:FTR1 family protein [Jiella sp. MQZ9-1]|uniref:FTR1 family protein n=1 Tax=Jiella flava TaxID=2816857 RepID=A0A939G130_9HYPH|nr:FTR1 family protein [Jiella flava]MBO0663895.1 FTR1 family protein [Jiella flava]MCD2472467.1 FTR1 family protein [Jiella flava]